MNLKERPISSIEGRIAVVEPIEIFPGQQEIQKPAFKKTPQKLEVEQVTNEGLREFLEGNDYVGRLGQGYVSQVITNISGHIQIRDGAISDWLKIINVLPRSMSEGSKLAWQNPEQRQHKIEGIHSPAANRKSSETRRRNFQSLSEADKNTRLEPAKEYNRQAMIRHMREALGENPKERLWKMHWQQELSPVEIGEELKVSPSTVKKWMKNLGIKITEPHRQHGSIKTKKEEKQNLVRQAREKGLIEMLPAEEQFVINARFPIEGTIASFTRTGQELDPNRPVKFSREYIRQIQEGALGKLANELNKVSSFG